MTVTITERMVPVACDLVGRVRSGNKQAIRALLQRLTPQEGYALVVVLAAMIPTDRSPGELLDWLDDQPAGLAPRVRLLRPCGTHAAYWRHKNRGEVIDPKCLSAERAYQRARKQERKRVA